MFLQFNADRSQGWVTDKTASGMLRCLEQSPQPETSILGALLAKICKLSLRLSCDAFVAYKNLVTGQKKSALALLVSTP